MKVLTSKDDDFLYFKLIDLLGEVKLVQGGSSIPPTLRRHKEIKDYLIEKQRKRLDNLENTFFTEDGLDQTAVENWVAKSIR